ncbi:mucin TcMUCII [Trypanosoma cruzi Dm28c]|uniref:Mucin TcMUCII n=1 Tax=Trypanosoma cruzi Dm28c TaxID=1416333 RepID=V5D5R3_TRYCR|nr:mucin TcMUCII [Trypanosoma cruzi Dm28c]
MPVRQGTQEASPRTLDMDQALPPPPHHGCHGLLIPTDHGRLRLIHFGNALPLRIWTVTVWDCSSLHEGLFATECLSLLYGEPLRYLLIPAREKQYKKLFCDGYWLRFPWNNNPRGARGIPFYCYFAFCCCVRCASSCVCVPFVRGADTTDRSRLVCRSCLLLPLPSVCCCCGRAVCVCLLPWIGVCVVRGVRRTVHAWLLPSPHVVCPLCVSAAPLVSPVALHFPHCADQLHTTERPHSR